MALTDSDGSGMVMPIAPMYGGGNGFGNGFGGDGGWWILLLFILLAGGNGWGNSFGGGWNNDLYPWMNQAELTTGGFQNQLLNDNVSAIRDGVQGLSTQLCNCCGDMQMSLANGFANAETAANARQMANMQQNFALQSQFADCCCENRLGIADLKYTVATENCADRAALSDGVRDIIANQTASVQRILDQLCQDKIDAKNDEIAQLRQEVLYARGQASQISQNEQIVNSIYNRLDTCPVGTTPVYGRTPIFTCNNGCGCGNV